MAGGVNRVQLIGNIGADPEVRYTPSGQAVCNFRIATSDSWTDKQGQKQERTEWHRIVAWGKTAELVGEFCSKGRQVYLEGRLQTREWMDKENRKNFTTEIVTDKVMFLAGGGKSSRGGTRTNSGGSQGQRDDFGPPPPGLNDPPAGGGGGPGEEDVPF